MLSDSGVTQPEQLPQTRTSGAVAEIRTAVIEGNSYYFLRLEGGEVYYAVSASENPVAVLLNLGDKVTIGHAVQTGEEDTSILSAYSLTIDGKAAPAEPLVTPNETEPAGDSADTSEDGAVTVPIYG